MTFDAIRTAISVSDLTAEQRAELRRMLRARTGAKRGVERGMRCSINHPGVESVWIPRTETRWNRKGAQVTYHGSYCDPCRSAYDARDEQVRQ